MGLPERVVEVSKVNKIWCIDLKYSVDLMEIFAVELSVSELLLLAWRLFDSRQKCQFTLHLQDEVGRWLSKCQQMSTGVGKWSVLCQR